jgi:hypothetical protein
MPAEPSPDAHERFDELVDDCGNRFVGRVTERLDLGDHRGLLLEPVAAEIATPRADFRFHRARRVEPGHPA